MARALFGEIPVQGHLPVTIPGVPLKAGFGAEVPANPMKLQPMEVRAEAQLQPAFDVIESAIKDQAFPGATLAVGYRGKVSLHAFGKLTYDRKSPAVGINTMYDIASLTKVVATTTLVAKLAEGDFPVPIDLDARVDRYLPEWAAGPQPEWRHRVTVRHLLTHTSGLPPFKEYWRTSKSKLDTLDRIFAEPLEYEPGAKEVYSDLGIILMAEIIERLTGKPLDVLARENIFGPLAMSNSMYKPAKKLWPAIAPTEIDNQYRHRPIQGEVHDENAAAIGGVSGHAGVFSTAPDLANFCQMLLDGGVYAHQRILRRSTIAEFTTPQQLSSGARTLGWAVPTEGGSSGHFFSPHSFGHTGFTGTSIWIDPDRQAFRGAACQSRISHAGESETHQGTRCAPRRGDAVARPRTGCRAGTESLVFQDALLQILFGLPEVLRLAEIAPIILVRAESADSLALASEPKVSADDRKDSVFSHLFQQSRRNDVDPGKCQGLEILRRRCDFVGRFSPGAPAAQPPLPVEQQLARTAPLLDGQGRQCGALPMRLRHFFEVDGADNVHVVQQERSVAPACQKKPGGPFQPAAGIEQQIFPGHFDPQAQNWRWPADTPRPNQRNDVR
jgi:CubicO group peptidase (beta-lactamase class C family)